ncbi:MAG: c-type cytochrome domain-containing protein [Chitinophagia bacterium]
MERIINLFGHFHPLLVHLPIGILLFSILIHGLSYKERFASFVIIIPFTYLIGALAAILSCLSGLALSSQGEYDEQVLFYHQWLGISVALFSILGVYFTKKKKEKLLNWISITLLVLIFITGHLGGTLTHGEGYLTKSTSSEKTVKVKPIITMAQEAYLYADIIQPILEEKCYGCHSKIKQKGKLRLDTKEWILKGGEDGIIIHNGAALNSPLYKKIILDPVDEKHMPPKGKPQITEQERILLEWWINSGGYFDKKVKELTQPPSIAPILTKLEKNTIQPLTNNEVPDKEIQQANQNNINALTKWGVTILKVANNSNYLTANFITVAKTTDTIDNLIKNLGANIVWLKMPRMNFTSALATAISFCDSLTRLSIEHSSITDNQLNSFQNLKRIHYLNLVGTKITLKGLLQLKRLSNLNELYLGESNIINKDSILIQKTFPKAKIIFGNYRTENLPTDTMVVKVPPKK